MPRWPAEWNVARVIRERGGVAVLATEDGHVLVTAPAERRDALGALARGHGAVDSAFVPPLRDEGETDGAPFVRFACDAVTDMEELVHAAASREERVPYGQGIAFNEFLMDSTEAVHAQHGPFGALGLSSVWVSADGRLWLAGVGADLLASGAFRVEAPERMIGVDATPASDVFVIHTLIRNLLPYVELPVLFEKVIRGIDAGLGQALNDLGAGAAAPDPARRPQDVAALRKRYRSVRALAPTMLPEPESEALAATLSRLARLVTAHTPALHVDELRARVTIPGGEVIDLARRAAQWRILRGLVRAHLDRPGEGLSLDELQAVGWPDEALVGTSGRARVYVAISSLRKLGLSDWIVGREGTYSIAPDARVEISLERPPRDA